MSKVKNSLLLNDFYDAYAIRMREKGLKPKPRKEYLKIIKTMAQVYRDELLENGIVNLAWKTGDVYVSSSNRVVQDFEGPNKSKIQFNDHSNGTIKKFYWLSANRKNKKPTIWTFSAERKMKRMFAKMIKSGKVYPDFKKMFQMI